MTPHLSGGFCSTDLKNASLSESLTYPGSHLNEVFWCNLIRKFKVPVNSVPVSESPTYPGSHLTRVYCMSITVCLSEHFPEIISILCPIDLTKITSREFYSTGHGTFNKI